MATRRLGTGKFQNTPSSLQGNQMVEGKKEKRVEIKEKERMNE